MEISKQMRKYINIGLLIWALLAPLLILFYLGVIGFGSSKEDFLSVGKLMYSMYGIFFISLLTCIPLAFYYQDEERKKLTTTLLKIPAFIFFFCIFISLLLGVLRLLSFFTSNTY